MTNHNVISPPFPLSPYNTGFLHTPMPSSSSLLQSTTIIIIKSETTTMASQKAKADILKRYLSSSTSDVLVQIVANNLRRQLPAIQEQLQPGSET